MANATVISNNTIKLLVPSNKNLTENIERITTIISNLQVCKKLGYGAKTTVKKKEDMTVDNSPPWDTVGYFHSHGNMVRIGHTSATCDQ